MTDFLHLPEPAPDTARAELGTMSRRRWMPAAVGTVPAIILVAAYLIWGGWVVGTAASAL